MEINLYDLSVEILKDRDVWNRILDIEESVSKEQFKELLQGVLDPEKHLIPAIAVKLKKKDFDVLFLSGVGEVFPYIRSHNVLNNLQSTAKKKADSNVFPPDLTRIRRNQEHRLICSDGFMMTNITGRLISFTVNRKRV